MNILTVIAAGLRLLLAQIWGDLLGWRDNRRDVRARRRA